MNDPYVVSIYDMADATGEILIMLLVAFVLGVMFGVFFERNARRDRKRTRGKEDEEVILLPAEEHAIIRHDNLQIIEGIGPKIEAHLKKNGVTSYFILAHTPVERIQAILEDNGERFRAHSPQTWPEQARLAYEGKFEELKQFQNSIN